MLRHYMGELIITAKQGDSFTADYLLTHYEYPEQAALRKDNEIVLFCTDEIICHAKQLRLPINENCIKWLLVKNGIDTKYDSTYLAHLSGHQPEWTYYLPYHEKDAIRRCYLGTDRHYRLKDLSELMRKLLLELAVRTTEIDVKRIKAAIKEG